jgi:hypothetical protein
VLDDIKDVALHNLTDGETEVVFQCLRCVASGEVILNDWEFQTLFGIEFETLEHIVASLPDIDEDAEDAQLAINNSMAHLLGYPHNREARMKKYVLVPLVEVARIFSKWRGEPLDSYINALR